MSRRNASSHSSPFFALRCVTPSILIVAQTATGLITNGTPVAMYCNALNPALTARQGHPERSRGGGPGGALNEPPSPRSLDYARDDGPSVSPSTPPPAHPPASPRRSAPPHMRGRLSIIPIQPPPTLFPYTTLFPSPRRSSR